jgi:hypothetical protein
MSGPRKGLRLLRPSEIYELIVYTDSGEARVPSDVSSVEGGFLQFYLLLIILSALRQ